MIRLVVLASLVAVLAACGGVDRPTDVPTLIRALESSDPAERSWAIAELGKRGVRSAVPGLVARLRDEDGGIRLYAIGALRHLTGEDHGFRPLATAAEREQAVLRWEASLRPGSGEP